MEKNLKNKIIFSSFLFVTLSITSSVFVYQWAFDKRIGDLIEELSYEIKSDIRNFFDNILGKKNIKTNIPYGLINKNKIQTNFKEHSKIIESINISSKSKNLKDYVKNNFEEKNYFLSLLSYSEGFVENFYSDNIGQSIGFGFNPSMQSKETNDDLFSYFNLQDVYNSKEKQNIKFNFEQATFAAIYLNEKTKNEIFNIIGEKAKDSKIFKNSDLKNIDLGKNIFAKLNDHEKDVIFYHNYKVGSPNFRKYEDFLNALIEYSNNKNKKNKDLVGSLITYKYIKDGQILYDERAKNIVTTMWNNPKDFITAVKLNRDFKYPYVKITNNKLNKK